MTLKELRKTMNMSQRKFADHFGIPVTNIQHWEQGVSRPPDYVLAMMVRIFELESADLEAR